jgi:hypothetical protein
MSATSPTIETAHGLEVAYCGRGYDATEGYRLVSGYAKVWHSKAEATKAAQTAGPTFVPVRAHTSLARRLWVVHNDHGGGFLTEAGWERARALRATQHRTRTYAYGHQTESYNVNTRGMTGYRVTFTTSWCCTCGNGGFGEDRDRASAQQRAKLHRDHPDQHPGQPWNPATVAALRAAL